MELTPAARADFAAALLNSDVLVRADVQTTITETGRGEKDGKFWATCQVKAKSVTLTFDMAQEKI